MSKTDWTQKLQEQLADYQEPVKDDLWAGISKSLAQQDSVRKEKAKRVVMLQRWSVAAALALAVAGGGLVYMQQNQNNGGALPMAQIASEPKTPAKALVVSQVAVTEQNIGADRPFGIHAVKPEDKEALSSSRNKEVLLASASPVSSLAEPSEASVVSLQSAEVPNNVSVAEGEECSIKENKHLKQDDALFGVGFERKVKASYNGDWNVQLYAENGIMSSQGNNSPYPMMEGVFYASASKGDFVIDENLKSLAPLMANVPTASKHHAPVSVGVQVGFCVAPKLSVTTGVVYTRTSSEFAVNGSEAFNKKQVLHYVGIPLGVNYEFWHIKGLHTYVMAGGEADWNVKNATEVEGEKIEGAKRDRIQFSGKASLGAQVDVTPAVGIYVEPGFKYYFDNGSDISNSFKDKKMNFNFQFGLRFNL